MAYWLLKSEPSVYSWEHLVKDGRSGWEGVRNYAARLHLRAMKKGDKAFFYHSNKGTEIVGIAEILREAYQDPTTPDDWSSVDIKPVRPLKKSVSLAQVKDRKDLADMALIRLGRLSVQPVTEKEWKAILEMAGEK